MRIADLKNRAVVSIAEGSRLGRVETVAIDTGTLRVAALHCAEQGQRFIVPFALIKQIGNDAITVESSNVTQVDGQAGTATGVVALDAFLKLKAVDDGGTFVGTVSQLDFDPATGQLTSLDAHRGGVLGLGGTTTTIPASDIRAIGPEIVTVAAPAAAEA